MVVCLYHLGEQPALFAVKKACVVYMQDAAKSSLEDRP